MTVILELLSHGPTLATRHARFARDDALLTADASLTAPQPWAGRACHSSPATACRQTAALLGLSPELAPELADLDCGRWAGTPVAEVAAREPDGLAGWMSEASFRGHGGESRADLSLRTAAWLERVKTAGGHAVAITHAAVIRALILHALGGPDSAFWRLDIAPLTITELRHDGRRWAVRSMGCALKDHPTSPD